MKLLIFNKYGCLSIYLFVCLSTGYLSVLQSFHNDELYPKRISFSWTLSINYLLLKYNTFWKPALLPTTGVKTSLPGGSPRFKYS
jgi:hypothetical protein